MTVHAAPIRHRRAEPLIALAHRALTPLLENHAARLERLADRARTVLYVGGSFACVLFAVVEWPPPGYELVWTPTAVAERGTNWQVLPPGTPPRRCRYWTSPTQVCGSPSVARMLLVVNRVEQWWHYCEAHLYGRRIRDGVLETQTLQPIGGAA